MMPAFFSLTLHSVSLHQAVPAVMERALNGMAVGVAIALMAALLLRLAPKPNSGTRFAVWFGVLVTVAVLPFWGFGPVTAWLAGSRVGSMSEVGGGASSLFTLSAMWAEGLFAFWAVMAGAGLVRVGVGLWHVRQLRKSCVPVDFAAFGLEGLQPEFAAASVGLSTSDQVRVPAAIGFFKPTVIVPAWTLTELSSAELNAVLLHELAHLKRRDDWTNLAQKLVRAVFFFHPAVWWVDRQLSLEREMACDDLVLAQTPNPRAYAQCLVRLAEKSALRRGLALAQAAVRGLRQTSARVAQILDMNRPQATTVSRPAIYAVAVLSVVGLTALPHVPRLLAFEDAQPVATMGPSSVAMVPGVAPILAKASVPSNFAKSPNLKPPANSRSFAVLASQSRLRTAQDDKAEKLTGDTHPALASSGKPMTSEVKQASLVATDGKGMTSVVAMPVARNVGLSPCGSEADCDSGASANQAAVEARPSVINPASEGAWLARALRGDDAQTAPIFLRATSTELIEERVTPQGVFVVMQRQQFDAQGRLVWSVSVYHLTVFHPANPAGIQVPAKKT